MKPDIVTIGVYGFDRESFFQALLEAKVDTFCDIRLRRGVRGATYAFANSQRLQARLAELNIRYLHIKDLAPTKAVRELQFQADKSEKVAKRKRKDLSPTFVDAYQSQILAQFDPNAFLAELGPEARIVALFCVETHPEACHRSLVAGKLQAELGLHVEHIVP